jgi:DNA-binding PucR family transcriptional regulator
MRHQAERTAALEAFIEVSAQIHAEEFNPGLVLNMIVERTRSVMGSDVAWMSLADHERGISRPVASAGENSTPLTEIEVKLGTGLSGLAARAGRTIILDGDELYGAVPPQAKRALQAAGVVSVMCAPMRHEHEVGALLVGGRVPGDFDEADAALLEAFAQQAAITISNSHIYRDLATKNTILERTLAVHRELGNAALEGNGVDSIVARLERLIDRAVEFVAREQIDLERHGVEVLVGGECVGRLEVGDYEGVSELEHNAILQAATIVSLEMTKQRATEEVEWRLRGELLEEILLAGDTWSDGLLARCERLGIDPRAERCVAVLEPVAAASAAVLAGAARTAAGRLVAGKATLTTRRGDSVVVAIESSMDKALLRVRDLLERAERAGAPARAGVSGARTDATVALREAQAALRFARQAPKPGVLVSYEQLGRLRFLLAAPDTSEMVGLVTEVLGPLADYDRGRKASMLETVRVFLDSGGHHATTAKRCHIHASTLKYRLARISEILDCSLADPATRFDLSLAFAVRDLLATLGINAP